jgi:hypothetical protein
MTTTRKAPAAKPADGSLLDDLPFVASRGKGERRDFWHNVHSTGDTLKDQRLGMQLAYFTLQTVKSDDFAPLLGLVVLGMIEKQTPAHIVIGFCQTIADVCLGYHQIPAADMTLDVPASMQRANPKRTTRSHDRAA